ncbi:MAG TPA: hypothetical protein VHT30_04220 [Acidimicrobiales bacterium]|nr:hypothetical protein [Acidimicrobiales bacterium]
MALRESKKSGDEGLPAEFKELIDLIVTYAKQQTIDPLKQLLRWVGWGVAGAVAVGLGLFLIGLGLLRAIQSETGRHLHGDWSWVPYLVVVVYFGIVVGVMVRSMTRGPRSSKER